MKVKCIIQFFDRELGKIINAGKEYIVHPDRGTKLVAAGVAEEVIEDVTQIVSEEPKATRKRTKK